MSGKSPIDQAIEVQVATGIALFQAQFIRRNGGVPANPTGQVYGEAIDKLNQMIQDESSPVTTEMARNVSDLLAVLNAQHHGSQQDLENTLGLFASLALPSQENESKEDSKAV